MGTDFTVWMDIGREINFAEKMQADREKQEYYDLMQKRKLELFGPDHWIPFPKEEGEGEGDAEAEEEAE